MNESHSPFSSPGEGTQKEVPAFPGPEIPPHFRCGFVSIVGRPNVGKSTLLNRILEEKVSIVSKVPQTTRHLVRGVYNDQRGQIIFVDTPGLIPGKDKLDHLLIRASLGSLGEADCIIHLVDTSVPTGVEEHQVVTHLKGMKVPVILGLNKIDLKGKYVPQYISLWEEIKGKKIQQMDSLILLPLSGKKGLNIEKLIDQIYQYLPEGPPLYPRDTVCDLPQKIAIADIIREKFLGVLRDEIPHSIAVVVEEMEPRRKNVYYIRAEVLVERDSQKEIVIGKKGLVLKEVGILARKELEELLESKVFLEIYVRCEKRWRDNRGFLQDLGYDV